VGLSASVQQLSWLRCSCRTVDLHGSCVGSSGCGACGAAAAAAAWLLNQVQLGQVRAHLALPLVEALP